MNDYIFNYYQYKKSINKNNFFSFVFIFLVIILLLSACIFLKPKQTKITEFYFIEIEKFPTYQNALILSEKIASQGGAGYIFFDTTYHVFASFYSNKKDAENVLKNVLPEYKNSCIFTLSISHFQPPKKLTSAQNYAVENFLNETKKTIIQLEKIFVDFDKKVINFNNALITIKSIQGNYNSAHDNLIYNFKNNSKYNIAKKYAEQMYSSLLNITNSSEEKFTSILKYETINFVINSYYFLGCF